MVGNRATEKDIRDYLSGVGYYGRSARIGELELTAVGESGWVQVFRGQLDAKHQEDGWRSFHFVLRDDERSQFAIELFDKQDDRDQRLEEWSQGLLRKTGDRDPRPVAQLVAAGFVIMVLAALVVLKLM